MISVNFISLICILLFNECQKKPEKAPKPLTGTKKSTFHFNFFVIFQLICC